MVNKTHIRVEKSDLQKLMTKGVKLFLEEHPEFEEFKITQLMMFKRAVNFYCKE